jgi:hypothetical protein
MAGIRRIGPGHSLHDAMRRTARCGSGFVSVFKCPDTLDQAPTPVVSGISRVAFYQSQTTGSSRKARLTLPTTLATRLVRQRERRKRDVRLKVIHHITGLITKTTPQITIWDPCLWRYIHTHQIARILHGDNFFRSVLVFRQPYVWG